MNELYMEKNSIISTIQRAEVFGFVLDEKLQLNETYEAAKQYIEKYVQNFKPFDKVTFEILKVEDVVKHGSEVSVGARLSGEIEGNKIFFTDKSNIDWIFYIGDTCKLIIN